MVEKKTKYKVFGVGGFLQLTGLIALFIFPIGTVIGIFLIIAGQIASKQYICGACGNAIPKSAKICPVCKAELN